MLRRTPRSKRTDTPFPNTTLFRSPDNFFVIIHIKDANDARNHFPIIGQQTNPVYPFCEHRVSAGRTIQNLASAIGVDTVLALRLATDRFPPLDRPPSRHHWLPASILGQRASYFEQLTHGCVTPRQNFQDQKSTV